MTGNLNTIIMSISDEELEYIDDNAYKKYRNKLKNPEKYLEMLDNIYDKIHARKDSKNRDLVYIYNKARKFEGERNEAYTVRNRK